MYKKIADYGIIGNSQAVALVGNDGSIDWLCLPSMDSPSVFAALLDARRGGHFAVTPRGDWDSTAAYKPGTNVLETTFRTSTGRMRLTDFMPIGNEEQPREESTRQVLYRCVEITEGVMEVALRFAPRFDYARAQTLLKRAEGGVTAHSGEEILCLQVHGGGLEIEGNSAGGCWHLAKGDLLWMRLVYGDEPGGPLDPKAAQFSLEETRRYWQRWLEKSETGQDYDFGPFAPMIERSSLVLKLLDFAPTGAIAAAATTSLPEEIGGVRNWDYRYFWIRDSALTVEALFNIGHLSEMESYLHWLNRFICECTDGKLQVLYGLRGETSLPEEELHHLEGYKQSGPVRIGNGAYDQKQLDIYGEIMDAALRLSNYVGKISMGLWPFLRTICDTVVEVWQEKDSGIWEVRGGPHHFVFSKVMCWVALDRGLTIARRYGFPANQKVWEKSRDAIRREVLEKGWSDEKQAFVQHYDTEALDASNLLLPFYEFLPYDDERMVSTVEATRRELGEEGFIYRYRCEDGLSGGEGTFLLCTFWLVDNLIGQGRLDEAQILLLRLEGTANALGLFGEQYDPLWRETLGNFPQAFTHIGYINSVFALCRSRRAAQRKTPKTSLSRALRHKLLVTRRYRLNAGTAEGEPEGADISKDLKHLMNLLRGAFFITDEGRVAYEHMAESPIYSRYQACSRHLQHFDLDCLQNRAERMAFWINLFNVLVIHGVIELGIRDSVKEVPRFFRRIGYCIDDMEFTADHIEHGILRGNRRFPGSLFHPFGKNDRRRLFALEKIDPRIHFALVCASRSCPPIEIYSAETLDHDLDISAETFLNSGGVGIDRDAMTVRLPKIFDWYATDFGADDEERLLFVASFLFDEQTRRFLERNAKRLKVKFEKYDWRLNRN